VTGLEMIQQMGERAREAASALALAGAEEKNGALAAIAAALGQNTGEILAANRADLDAARADGMAPAMLDRLALDEKRVQSIAAGVEEIIALPDPVGRTDAGWTRPNGLSITRVRVPLGVVGIIYEARPNVTADAAALCLKSGNACILRGGKEAVKTNIAIAGVMRQALEKAGLPADAVQLVEDTSRETSRQMMGANGLIDVLIPRGGAGLIRAVVENATVPVIQTGVGNCHVYVDSPCDLEMAVNIIQNAKCSRPSVCNAAETLLVHREVADRFLPMAKAALDRYQVQLRGCPITREILGDTVVPATGEDYATEYNDYILAVRVVGSLEEAVAHIRRYSTGHSEAIVTSDYQHSQQFTRQVDAAAVYVNASTRFTDGGQFGLGAEIGISTQKLHARGPMGLEALTTTKYIVLGSGQVR
jgi:glutamate-5-semialdehyde dehydrogenase